MMPPPYSILLHSRLFHVQLTACAVFSMLSFLQVQLSACSTEKISVQVYYAPACNILQQQIFISKFSSANFHQ